MSLTLIARVWTQFPEGAAKLALMQAIAEASSDQGNCYETVARLAAAGRISRAQAFRALRELRDERWVVTTRVLGQNGVLVIQLNLPKLERSGPRAAHTALRHRAVPDAAERGLLERLQPARAPESHDEPLSVTAESPTSTLIRHAQELILRRHRSPFSADFASDRSAAADGAVSDSEGGAE